MASSAILNFESLLSPISAESPAGRNLREDFSPESIYFKIKDARTAARSAERIAQSTYGDEDSDAEPPDWTPLQDLAPRILAEEAKDLEITAWLIETLVRSSGFAGLRDGFRLARELVEQYWETLYPLPDEDGLLTKIAPLTGLNGEGSEGTLIAPIAMVPITQGNTHGEFTAWHYDQAQQLSTINDPEHLQARIQAGAVTHDMFDTSVRETGVDFFRELVEDVDQCIDEYAQLTAALDSRCGPDSPPSSSIKQALEAVREKLSFITKDILLVEEPLDEAELEDGESGEGGGKRSGGGGPLQTRDDAFRALDQVAQFFRRTEPHSPISYNLEQIVRWGRLPLPDLIQELIQDPNARATYFQLTGIREPNE